MLSKTCFLGDVMRTFVQQWIALYYTPHYAEYDVHVRMPSADAVWISNVPYCLVCGHTLKFKTTDNAKQKKTKACVPSSPDVSLSCDIFGPLSEEYYAIHSLLVSFSRAFFFFLLHLICEQIQEIISLRKLKISFLLLFQKQ